MNKEDEVREKLKEVKFAFLKRAPAYYYLLLEFPVYYIDEEHPFAPALTDGKRIVLFKQWLDEPLEARYAIIKHELGHIFYRHPVRARRLVNKHGNILMLVNMIADGLVNVRLVKDEPGLSTYLVDWTQKFGKENLWKKSLEELVEEFKDSVKEPGNLLPIDIEIPAEVEEKLKENGKEIQKGSERIIEIETDEQLEKEVYKAIEKALVSAKTVGIGRFGSIEKELYGQLFKPKVDWISLLKSSVQSHVLSTVVQSWRKTSRKGDYLPGYMSFSRPKVIVAEDDSGSIDMKERKRFYSEMAGILQAVDKIVVIFWDDGVRDVVEFKSENDVEAYKKRFMGGTRFSPVAKYIIDNYDLSAWDVLIVMTDGEWFDMSRSVEYLAKIPAKKILVTTGRFVDGFDEVIEVGGDLD